MLVTPSPRRLGGMNAPWTSQSLWMSTLRGITPFVEFLHGLASRWDSLYIHISAGEDLALLKPLSPQPTTSIVWSNLHTLVLRTEGSEHGRTIEQLLAQDAPSSECREAFPSLQKVELHQSSGPLQIPTAIPWSRLTSLRLGGEFNVDPAYYLLILSQCPNLRDLDIDLAGRYPAAINRRRQPTPVLTLRHLERLYMHTSDSWRDDGWVLVHLHLPALRSLTYSMQCASYPTQRLVELATLLRRSSSSCCSETLGYLELRFVVPYVDPPEAVLRDLFESVPNLTRFKVFQIDHAHFLELLPRGVRELVVVVMYRDLQAMYEQWCEELLRRARRCVQGGTSQDLTISPPPPLDVQIHIWDNLRVPDGEKDFSRFTQKFGDSSVSVTM